MFISEHLLVTNADYRVEIATEEESKEWKFTTAETAVLKFRTQIIQIQVYCDLQRTVRFPNVVSKEN